MAIAVTGAGGQLGWELCRRLGERGIGLGHRELDVTDRDAVLERMAGLGPEAVINAAAYTQVDRAESEPQRARAVNAEAVEHLAEACRRLGCPLVQISTDYVFTGDPLRATPWREDDAPDPPCVYGATKLAGERAAAFWERHLVVRTCGLYAHPASGHADNFPAKIARAARAGKSLRVVHDQRCTPSFVPHVARATLYLLESAGGGAAAWGTYHVTNRGAASWYELAVELLGRLGITAAVEPVTSAEYPTAARRPVYSVLDTGKYEALGGPELPPWQEAVAEYAASVGELAGGGG